MLREFYTFDYYNIKNGDSIIALPIQSQRVNPIQTTQWMTLTKDSDCFDENMKWLINPRTTIEASRLNDLHLMKFERKSRMFIKLTSYAKLGEDEGVTEEEVSQKLKYEYDKATEPSTQALPVIWSNEEES